MRRLLAAITLLLCSAVPGGFALAGTVQHGLVSEHPVPYTPNVVDGAVAAIAVVDDVVVVGGDFTAVTDPRTGARYPRPDVFAYEMTTGRLLPFAPALDGPVTALAAGANRTVYVAGAFGTVDGAARAGLVQLDLTTAQPVVAFGAKTGKNQVRTLATAGPWLYVGGSFTSISGRPRTGLARLSAQTGAVDAGLDLRLARAQHGTVKVEALAVSLDGTRLAAVGAFDSAAGRPRAQLALADVASPDAVLSGWSTTAYTSRCDALYDSYLRGVDFAPDGSYMVVAATGGMAGAHRMCDSAARFDVTGTGAHDPAWVNRTGGNTLWSVAVTDTAVYVGGHQRWVDNPQGHKTAGPGAVARPGIAALDPGSGRALPWNPTHSRGVGVGVLVACRAGLLVGSDTDMLGREYHGRVGMLPIP